MKVVVCQGETTGYPSRDELAPYGEKKSGKYRRLMSLWYGKILITRRWRR